MTGVQLGSVLRRVGVARVWAAPGSGTPGPGASGGHPVAVAAGRVEARLGPADRATWVRLGADDPDGVLARALAAWGALGPAAALADAWGSWDAATRAAVADPVHRLAASGRQTDATTCGSASLVLLAAAGDPLLAAWLATGRLVGGYRPAELRLAGAPALDALVHAPAVARFGALQRVVHRRSAVRALGPWPWPQAFGTPPWGAAREARFPGVRYRHVLVDDTDQALVRVVLDRAREWVEAGVPVPLYAGGDTGTGWASAVPRHVVLAVGARPGGLEVVEPSSGRLLTLQDEGTGRRDALGGWSHLAWAVLPVAL